MGEGLSARLKHSRGISHRADKEATTKHMERRPPGRMKHRQGAANFFWWQIVAVSFGAVRAVRVAGGGVVSGGIAWGAQPGCRVYTGADSCMRRCK